MPGLVETMIALAGLTAAGTAAYKAAKQAQDKSAVKVPARQEPRPQKAR
ncbi:MAG TPA: hypothetical protein VFQ34_00720 [Nitrospiraceae bacterium]|nr:hypothetical protein [Nitrospiraceae bacterium]